MATTTVRATPVVTKIIDGDGHIYERDEDIIPYLQGKYPEDTLRTYYLFPTLDGWRRGLPPRGHRCDVAGWSQFMDDTGISEALLYPTLGLAFAYARDPIWAADLARAYNDYVYDHFLMRNARLKAVALLPVQAPRAAAAELRRAINELGMVGGLLPTPGLTVDYGDPGFDPLYEAAQALGTMLAVHGAARQHGIGINLDYVGADGGQAFVLAHSFDQMSQFTHMIFGRDFERFPYLKVAFLEAGCGWVPYLIERIDRRTERSGRRLATEQVRDHPVYFHAELAERQGLPLALAVVGEDRFPYASDFPHEPDDEIVEVLEAFLAREDVSQSAKQKILCENITALYALQ
jgi:predicted TIM-barrel fold metal-dependent hydrolase